MKVDIIPYSETYQSHFYQINVEWLEKFFEVEPYDREVLTHPKIHILDKGGYIFFAKVGEKIAGTVALLNRENGVYELTKLGVYDAYKGQKIGELLTQYAVDFSMDLPNYTSVYLDSNTVLTPAIKLYKKLGFVEVPVPEDTPYARCNIRMVYRS